jgi:hypothetical protein
VPIQVTCPCGRKLRAKDEAAGRVTQCPSCGRMLDVPEPPMEIPIPVLMLDEPDPEVVLLTADSLIDPKPAGTRWSRNRRVVVGIAVPVVILAMVAGYVGHRRSVGSERLGILDELSKVDRLSFEDKNAEAAELYSRLVPEVDRRWASDPGVAAASRATREKVEAAKAEFAGRRVALEAAASKPRPRGAGVPKSANPGAIRGSIDLEKADGHARPVPGVEIRLLPARTTYANLGETGALLSLEVSRAKGFDMGTMTGVGPAFDVLRDTGVDLPASTLMTRFIDDNEWLDILSRITVRKALSDGDGEFRFDDVPGGDYLVHAVIRVPAAQMEWLVPASVDGGRVDVLLDIDHASYGLSSPHFEEDPPRGRPARRRAR